MSELRLATKTMWLYRLVFTIQPFKKLFTHQLIWSLTEQGLWLSLYIFTIPSIYEVLSQCPLREQKAWRPSYQPFYSRFFSVGQAREGLVISFSFSLRNESPGGEVPGLRGLKSKVSVGRPSHLLTLYAQLQGNKGGRDWLGLCPNQLLLSILR
jgi:hypothetical protein